MPISSDFSSAIQASILGPILPALQFQHQRTTDIKKLNMLRPLLGLVWLVNRQLMSNYGGLSQALGGYLANNKPQTLDHRTRDLVQEGKLISHWAG